MALLTGSLKLLFSGDRHLHGRLSLHCTRVVLNVSDGLHRLVDWYGHWGGDGGGHADYYVERATTTVLAAATTVAAVLTTATLYDGG